MDLQTAKELFAGSVGGIVQVLVGQPFDTVKVRLQTQSSANPIYSGMVDCAAKTLKNEGLGGFYKVSHVDSGIFNSFSRYWCLCIYPICCFGNPQACVWC